MDTLVNVDWLIGHLENPDLVVLDCSVQTIAEEDGGFHNVSGRAEYERRHIPTAGFADLTDELSDSNSAIEFALPTPEQFCAAMGALGVGDDSRVVLYDDSYMAWAARVWWMLRWVGFDRAALLNGGLRAWTEKALPVSTEPAIRSARQLSVATRPELIADRDAVLASIDDDEVQLIDTLPKEYYRGEVTLYHRPGHIPGATNVSGLDLLEDSGCFKSDAELASIIGGDRECRAITYCGGGIMASANAFVMNRLGFTDVAVYTASLQEWAADPANPMVVEA